MQRGNSGIRFPRQTADTDRGIGQMYKSTLENCRILIKNVEDGEIIADTKIIRHNSMTNVVTIDAGSLAEKKHYRIVAYIFAKECLYEANGMTKGVVVNNEIEVFLGKSNQKENRAKTRYPIELEGVVGSVDIAGR